MNNSGAVHWACKIEAAHSGLSQASGGGERRGRSDLAVYALVELKVADRGAMAPYIDAVEETITAHGGRFLVRAGATEVVEGSIGEFPVKVVVEFPSMDVARGWYASREYQAILPDRLNNSTGNFIWVEGV